LIISPECIALMAQSEFGEGE